MFAKLYAMSIDSKELLMHIRVYEWIFITCEKQSVQKCMCWELCHERLKRRNQYNLVPNNIIRNGYSLRLIKRHGLRVSCTYKLLSWFHSFAPLRKSHQRAGRYFDLECVITKNVVMFVNFLFVIWSHATLFKKKVKDTEKNKRKIVQTKWLQIVPNILFQVLRKFPNIFYISNLKHN